MNLGEIMGSWLRPANWIGWLSYFAGLAGAWTQEQAISTGLAFGGLFTVLVSAAVKCGEMWSTSRRKQRELDLEQSLAYDKRARDAGTTLDRLEGHVEQAGVERAELATQMRDLRETVAKLVETCQGEKCRQLVECLAPTPDGKPGCSGLGPDHSPLKPEPQTK